MVTLGKAVLELVWLPLCLVIVVSAMVVAVGSEIAVVGTPVVVTVVGKTVVEVVVPARVVGVLSVMVVVGKPLDGPAVFVMTAVVATILSVVLGIALAVVGIPVVRAEMEVDRWLSSGNRTLMIAVKLSDEPNVNLLLINPTYLLQLSLGPHPGCYHW